MKHLEKLTLITVLFILFACSSASDQQVEEIPTIPVEKEIPLTPVKEPKIKNGLYLILHEYADSAAANPEGIIVPFSHDFLDDNLAGQPTLLEIDTSEFVRLDLAHEPQGIEQEDKRINLMITLSDEASIQLANFTEKHLKERVAIVIGGKAVTKHKVRSRIEGGKLQITRCTDNACKYLLLELKNPENT